MKLAPFGGIESSLNERDATCVGDDSRGAVILCRAPPEHSLEEAIANSECLEV